ncbi:MAG TPA: hypothetical protein VHH90_07785 [Polyangia bacterium]|nr:hypothetical protein [Polyangia bacterium]
MSAGDPLNPQVTDPSLSDELARAESDVERARERVAQSMMALRNEVARQVDWRSWVQRRPMLFVGGALAVGFWLGNRR